jgi:hypothetical protein
MDEVVKKVRIAQTDPVIAREAFLKYLKEFNWTGFDKIEVVVENSEVESAILEVAEKEGYSDKISVKVAEIFAISSTPPQIHERLLSSLTM